MANYAPITNQDHETEVNHAMKSSTNATSKSSIPPPPEMPPVGWTVDGLPVGHPLDMQRSQWQSGLLSCFGNSDEFFSSDLEVCLLGTLTPCVLHGSNAERLSSDSANFANHCLPYTGLCIIGNCFFGWNCLAPWFSYHNRTAIRHKFNLEGNCESLGRLCGSVPRDEAQLEQCEVACDFATHVICHSCALCQEAREVRRRLPHPGLTSQPVFLMVPPGEQKMAPHLP